MARPKLNIPPGVTVVSPSQIDTAEQCWRKWGFTYILGQREPGGRGATFGGVVHERHEDYLEHGTVPTREETWTFRHHLRNELMTANVNGVEAAKRVLAKTSASQLDKPMFPGKVMLNMMPKDIYPAPGTGEVEHHFLYKREPKIWYQGLMDWHLYDRATRRLKVLDHKTSSDPKRYGLRSDAPEPDDVVQDKHMRGNKQVVIYARAGIEMYMDTKGGEQPLAVDLYWSYGKSDGVAKHSYVAETHFDNTGEVYARFENDVHPWAVEIHRLKTMGADPLTLDPNPQSCWLFNQECSHARECNLTTEDKIGALLMNAPTGNSLLQGLLSGANAGAAAPAAAPATAPVMPAPVPGDQISPPEAGGAVATAPAVALPAPVPPAAPPAAAPLPPAAPAAAPPPPVQPPPAAAPPVAPPPVAPVAPPATPPPVAPGAVAAAPPAPAPAQPPLGQVQVPADFWNVIANGIVERIIAGLKAGL